MGVRYLADYIVGSDRARRRIIRDCKFRATVRVLQHEEAKASISSHLLGGHPDPDVLRAKAEFIRSKLADGDFEVGLNEHNADYVERFADVLENLELPKKASLCSGAAFPDLMVEGLAVAFRPDLLLSRLGAKNEPKRGALAYRYKKGSPLHQKTGQTQSALMAGVMRLHAGDDAQHIDRALCVTLCAQSGLAHPAPTNAVSIFNDARAACATIAEQWEKITAPKGAVLA